MFEIGIETKNIYSKLGDDITKMIFANRLLYSLTSDSQYIRNVAATIECVNTFQKRIDEIQNNGGSLYIFGAGSVGQRLAKVYDNVRFDGFIDNNSKETQIMNLKVYSVDEIVKKNEDANFIISSLFHYQEIETQIENLGISRDKIINVGYEYAKLNECQYFDLEEFKNNGHEVFVDGGAYNGETTERFFSWCNNDGYSYIFEPDKDNIRKIRDKFKEDSRISIIEKGLFSKKHMMAFCEDGTSSSISDDGKSIIEVDSIDNICEIPPTFIKLDIEGSEYEALIGARNIIEKYAPKLAICVYHKDEDIIELLSLILQMQPKYKLYLRHYSFCEVETILYAIPSN